MGGGGGGDLLSVFLLPKKKDRVGSYNNMRKEKDNESKKQSFVALLKHIMTIWTMLRVRLNGPLQFAHAVNFRQCFLTERERCDNNDRFHSFIHVWTLHSTGTTMATSLLRNSANAFTTSA